MKNIYPRFTRVALKDWLAYHPYNTEESTDRFYIDLCNELQSELIHVDVEDHLVGSDYKYLVCMLVCYFEDIVSQTGMWTSFIDQHHKLYGKYLPFYDMAGYERGKVNMADIQFLTWHLCSNLPIHTHFTVPFSIEGAEIAKVAYDVLTEATNQAPVNEHLKAALTLPHDANIDMARGHLDFFFFGCYIHHYYTTTLMEEEILDVKNRKGTQKDIDDRRTHLLFNRVSPILAQHSGEILAHWAGETHPLYNSLMSFSKRKEDSLELHIGIIKREKECFLELTENKRIAFIESKRETLYFIENVWEIYHQKYGMDSIDRKKFDEHYLIFNVDEDLENMVIFFNPRTGMEFYPDIAQCIADEDNIFFDKYAEANIEDLILNERVSSDFILFLIDNQMIEIEPLSGKEGYHYVWANCDFLLRYWKKERYVAEPKIIIKT